MRPSLPPPVHQWDNVELTTNTCVRDKPLIVHGVCVFVRVCLSVCVCPVQVCLVSQCDLGQVALIMNHLTNILKHKHRTVHDFSVLTDNIMTITLISDVLNKHARTHTRCEPTESASLELTVDLSHCTLSSRRSLSSRHLSLLGRVSHDVITHTYIHTCTHTQRDLVTGNVCRR